MGILNASRMQTHKKKILQSRSFFLAITISGRAVFKTRLLN